MPARCSADITRECSLKLGSYGSIDVDQHAIKYKAITHVFPSYPSVRDSGVEAIDPHILPMVPIDAIYVAQLDIDL
jgi:hypothetical protein